MKFLVATKSVIGETKLPQGFSFHYSLVFFFYQVCDGETCLEEQEILERVVADAVVDPGAVVVETFYAVSADCTMSAASCANRFTVWTEIYSVEVIKE